jgi:hypothetical protein
MAKKRTLDEIIPQQVNANQHTPRGMRLLEQSIEQHGWIGAITAAADGEVFDGSARREKLATAGLAEPIFVETDGSRPVVLIRTDIPNADDPRAKQLALEANRIAELNLSYDPLVLAALREEGLVDDGLFTADEMGVVLQQAGDEVLAQAPEEFPTYGENIETQYCCPKCNYEWSGKPK